jgi:WASH complex subunit 7
VAADKKYSAAQLDVLSSLLLVERALHGPGTKERRLIAQLALATASQMKTFREEESLHLRILLSKLDAICELQSRLRSVCDCSFIYWHRVILHAYFAHLYESRNDLHRVTVSFLF